ncbi:unnamed protein product [Urochloa decumbens]|uniref:Exocyst subunit Exo70 family protein n=1 Tax=Urochloa decumbens TaxID=240449 RepID=A0ABC9E7T3_9POAL
MERVFRLRHPELPPAQAASLGELGGRERRRDAEASRTVAALASSPSKLLAALDLYVPLSENRVSLLFVLGDGDESPAPGAEGDVGHGLVAELVSCLEATLEEDAAALAFPGLRQVFMLNKTHAITRHAAGSDLRHLLPAEWLRVREERIEGYIKGYMDASWAPVVSRLDGGRTKQQARRRSPLSAFYAAFENACSAQRSWKVSDPALREALRQAVSEYVGPAYRRYLEDHPEVETAPGRTAEELEQQLSGLFEG